MSVYSFIRLLPAKYNPEFIQEYTSADGAVNIETNPDDTGTMLTKYVFYYKVASKQQELDDTISNYDNLYTEWARPTFIARVNGRCASEFAGGFTVPDGKGGELAGKLLQVRDTEDRTNWLTSQVAYSAACQAGQGAVLGATFRTAENKTITVSYTDGVDALLAMAAWGSAIMNRAWALKDAILSATTGDELDAAVADIDNGWPSSPPA